MYKYKYPRAALTVDAIVIAKTEGQKYILLIERGNAPFMGMWALPGGFVNMDETLEESCMRELFEEAGIKVEAMQQFRAFDTIDRDPRHRTISVVYYTFLDNLPKVKGGDDATKAQWFSMDELPQLAFDHNEVIQLFRAQVDLG